MKKIRKRKKIETTSIGHSIVLTGAKSFENLLALLLC